MATIDKIVTRPTVQVAAIVTKTKQRENWLRIDNGTCISWFKFNSTGWAKVATVNQKAMELDYQIFLQRRPLT